MDSGAESCQVLERYLDLFVQSASFLLLILLFLPDTERSAVLSFDGSFDLDNDTVYFAFTYPYTYTMVQEELANFDKRENNMSSPDSLYYKREILAQSPEGRNIDLLTVTSVGDVEAHSQLEPSITGLFPNPVTTRPPLYGSKEVIFISARVHPGEVVVLYTYALI